MELCNFEDEMKRKECWEEVRPKPLYRALKSPHLTSNKWVETIDAKSNNLAGQVPAVLSNRTVRYAEG